MIVVDDALDLAEREAWRNRLASHPSPPSCSLSLADVEDTALYQTAKGHADGRELIHAILFASTIENDQTEVHRDEGEYAVVWYPRDCPLGPLWTEHGEVEVKANRLVIFDCTTLAHRQILPPDGIIRYAVAFKFRR